METQYAKVNVPGYGTKEFPVADGIPPTPAQVKEWMQYNPEVVATWKKADPSIITKEAIDDVAQHLGPVDRAQLYTSMFFDGAGNNVSNALKYAKENPGAIAKGTAKEGAKIGLEAGGQMAGNVLGVALGGVGTVALGAAGATVGNIIGQMMDDDPFSWGDATAAFTMGLVPGASLAGAPARKVAMKGAQYALTGVAADTVRKRMDEGRWLTTPEALSSAVFGYGSTYLGKALDKASNAPTKLAAKHELTKGFENESRAMGRELGFVLPLTEVNNSPAYQKLQSVSGLIDPAKDAIRRNQPFLEWALERDIGIGAEIRFNDAEVYGTAAEAMRGTHSGSASRIPREPSRPGVQRNLGQGFDQFEGSGSAVRVPRPGQEGQKQLANGLPQIEGTGVAVPIPRQSAPASVQGQGMLATGNSRLTNGNPDSGEFAALIDRPDLPIVSSSGPIDFFAPPPVGFKGRPERSVGGQSADTTYGAGDFKQRVNMDGGPSDGQLGSFSPGQSSRNAPRNVGSSSSPDGPSVGVGGSKVNSSGGGSYTQDFGKNGVINPDTLPFHVARFTKSYQEAGQVSNAAAAALSDWRQANYNARQAWWNYRQPGGGSPDVQAAARAFEAESEEAFTRLSKEAALGGRKDLATPGKDGFSRLEFDRRMLGRLGAIEMSMNRGSGYKDADVLGRLLDAGAPLDGNLRKAARFNLSYGKYLKDKATTTPPGNSRLGAELTAAGMAGFGIMGGVHTYNSGGNVMQSVGAGLGSAFIPPIIRAASPSMNNSARRLMYSEMLQNAVRPDYGPTRMDATAAMARYAAARTGQQEQVQAPLNQYLRR